MLVTTITRDGELVKLQWDDFHVACMALATCFEAGTGAVTGPEKVYETPPGMFDCYPDAAFPITRTLSWHLNSYGALGTTPLNDGEYTLTRKHRFFDTTSMQVLTLLPGDVLRAVRH